jgi:hypothetical protein
MRHVAVGSIGETARALLGSGARGKVLAAVTGAAYLETEAGEVLWLTSPKAPRHTRAGRSDWRDAWPETGTRYVVRGEQIVFGSEFETDLTQAETWHAPQPGAGGAVVQSAIAPSLYALFAQGSALPTPLGLGQLIDRVLALGEERAVPHDALPQDLFVGRAWESVAHVAKACLAHDAAQIKTAVRPLVGLGPGLTPAGDDLVGSLLFTLHYLGRTYAPLKAAGGAAQVDLASLQAGTHVISFAVMSDMARGEGPEPLHEFLGAILAGAPASHIERAARQLVAIGHSSGWDMLLGCVVGMLSTFRPPTAI